MKTKILLALLLLLSGCSGGGGLFGGGGGGTVYVTKSGRSYHQSDCYTIKGSTTFSMGRQEAINAGYGQCQVCKP